MQLVNLIFLVVAVAVALTLVEAFPLIPAPFQLPTSAALLNKSVGESDSYAVRLEDTNESAAYFQDGQQQDLNSLWGHFTQRGLLLQPANETMEHFAPAHSIVQRGVCVQSGVEGLCNPNFGRDVFQEGLIYDEEDSKNVEDGLLGWNHTTQRGSQEKEVAECAFRDHYSGKRGMGGSG